MVPFHQLPALHRVMRPHLAVTTQGYGGFHRTYHAGLKGEGGAEWRSGGLAPTLRLRLGAGLCKMRQNWT